MKMQRFLRSFFGDLARKMMVEMVVRSGYQWENEGVWERCWLCLWENEKEKVERTTKLAGQETDNVRWFLCGGEAYRVGKWHRVSKIWPYTFSFLFFFFFFFNKGLGCYEISLGHSRTLSTWPHHKLPHGMILPNYINISLGHSRNLDTWPHHRLPYGMILIF